MTEFFHNELLPNAFRATARSALHYPTDVVESGSGYEFRNNLWSMPRRTFILPAQTYTIGQAVFLKSFFERRQGKLYGFLWLDVMDSTSGDDPTNVNIIDYNQSLRVLDDERRVFGLQKKYRDGRVRDIIKPNRSTLNLYRNRRRVREYIDFIFDWQNGRVIFHEPQEENAQIVAGFNYFTPVRFDIDAIRMTHISRHHIRVEETRVIELRITHDDYRGT